MYPARYFPNRMFAARFFPKVGAEAAAAPAAPDTGPSRWRRRRFNDRGNWNVLRTPSR
jgi:hypothetical protein